MAISIEQFGKSRPYLYHLTSSGNLERILRTGRLECAAHLLGTAGDGEWTRARRKQSVEVAIGREKVWIRDQAPLHRGNVRLEQGWEFEDLVELLNSMVFFWPGDDQEPIAYGVRHFERYEGEDLTILRVPFVDMVAANPKNPPLFCKYNSGSPRCSGGKPSPRSRETFASADDAPFSNSNVVEVTFRGTANLPRSTETASRPDGPWSKLMPRR